MNDKSYKIEDSMSDAALSQSIGEFIKDHRIKQNKTQEEVSIAAGISRSTLSLLERGKTVTIDTLLRALRVLDLLYILDVFKVDQQVSPIELAKLERQKRKRASGEKDNEQTDANWE